MGEGGSGNVRVLASHLTNQFTKRMERSSSVRFADSFPSERGSQEGGRPHQSPSVTASPWGKPRGGRWNDSPSSAPRRLPLHKGVLGRRLRMGCPPHLRLSAHLPLKGKDFWPVRGLDERPHQSPSVTASPWGKPRGGRWKWLWVGVALFPSYKFHRILSDAVFGYSVSVSRR